MWLTCHDRLFNCALRDALRNREASRTASLIQARRMQRDEKCRTKTEIRNGKFHRGRESAVLFDTPLELFDKMLAEPHHFTVGLRRPNISQKLTSLKKKYT